MVTGVGAASQQLGESLQQQLSNRLACACVHRQPAIYEPSTCCIQVGLWDFDVGCQTGICSVCADPHNTTCEILAAFATPAGFATAASTNGKPVGSNGKDAPPAQPSTGYKQPPKEILDIVDAPAQPALTFSPDRTLVRVHAALPL